MSDRLAPLKKSTYPIDRVAIALILVLSLVIGFVLWKGDRTAPKVRDFSWQNRQIGSQDTAFILSFNRPMAHSSVEDNLRIDPPLAGKFSWAGRRMAYTLTTPAPYGKDFQLTLQGARDRFSPPNDVRAQITPFTGQFRSRDRAFVYLGVTGDEAGRLVLQELTRQKQTILTPKNLVVMDFEPYPQGDRILFSATERSNQVKGSIDQQLYTVSTGIQVQSPEGLPAGNATRSPASPSPPPTTPIGTVELVLDSKEYQNLKFDLAPNGQSIVVQRVNRQNPSQFGLWILKSGEPPQPIKTDPGGDFLIAPDSSSLAMAQGQGMAILPLQPEAERLDFLPKFGMVLTFSNDGTEAAMVKFNVDPNNPTRSLFLVNNQGREQELLKTDGAILSAQFDPANINLYCLYSRRIPGDVYAEQPLLAVINLKTAKGFDLLSLPQQRDIQMSVAPDGLGILFDQIVATETGLNATGAVRNSEGKAIANSRLWLFPLELDAAQMPTAVSPQDLGLAGLRPRWLP